MKTKSLWIVLVLLVLAILGGTLLYFVDDSNNVENELVEFETSDGELVKVFEEQGNITYEGNILPQDIDFNTLLPKLPPTSELLNVIDNRQGRNRFVTTTFKIYRSFDQANELILKGLGSEGWVNISVSENGIIQAEQNGIMVYVDIYERQKTYVQVDFIYNFKIIQEMT